MEIFIISMAILVGIVVYSLQKKAKEVAAALAAYKDSLAELSSNPTNSSLRQQTLSLGRIYSNVSRDKKGVTTFDEVALMNDINAACAGAATIFNNQPAEKINVESSLTERLLKLTELRNAELITEVEYTERRSKILGDI